MKTILMAAVAAVLAFACPASASEPTKSPPPAEGQKWMPRGNIFVCTDPIAFHVIFGKGRSTSANDVIKGQMAAEATVMNGKPLCMSGAFKKPVSIVANEKVGGFTLDDGRVFDAWMVAGEFPDGMVLFILWPQLVEGFDI